MSGKTAVGTEETGLGRDGMDDGQGLATQVADALDGAEPEAIVYRDNTGTLDAPAEEWQRVDSVAALPESRLDGWDELFVYTETHVYRWVGVGFDRGPERLPRDPGTLPGSD